MTDQTPEDSAEQAKQLHEKAVNDLFTRPITQQELYYIIGRYPYLELCNAQNPYVKRHAKAKVSELPMGCFLFDFDSVMIVGGFSELAQGQLKAYQEAEDDDGEGEDELRADRGSGAKRIKQGTLINRAILATEHLINLAKDRWQEAEVISGYYTMQRYAWIYCNEIGYPLDGFYPTPEDRVVEKWVAQLKSNSMYPTQKPILHQP